MPLPKSPSTQYEENGREEEGFHNALLELKDLRSQLHHAVEHCERAFSEAQQKKIESLHANNMPCVLSYVTCNWTSNSLNTISISVLTGHNQYVMCASFYPSSLLKSLSSTVSSS
ncbi:hypothetical protein ZIOFF_005887 [Zingiber officinale]|uniref:Uncharacterized protein n=1 Tax=Zingiber officinale TaxID=94328 RepID=A0A8J5LRY6_ZINOF|nr:hypothetical protein ZIOFF_005887 [Zingiber officinale]